jgi:threonine synthase
MHYYSLNQQSPIVDFKTATINGQAPDGGLYFPKSLPRLSDQFLRDIKNHSREAIAYALISPFVGETIPPLILQQMVSETIDFPIPLKKITESIYSLELFHGPTLAFKDIGARFMSRCLGYFARKKTQRITVLVATSGDTGGAVASGFHKVDGVDVVILYPSGKVSAVQEKQLTTFGDNIHALEVQGNFDDCQRMVKQAFTDHDLRSRLFLTSANSINVARWLPQQFYYFFALQQWPFERRPVFSVPSGNFGNICAGLMAYTAGLPVKQFIAACNANDMAVQYMASGNYLPKQAVPTISNAMDVGNPSNFIRILEIFKQQQLDLKSLLSGYSTTDARTSELLLQVYRQHHYLLDPHGAVGYDALMRYQAEHADAPGIVLETAHPIKFLGVVEPVIGESIPVPPAIADILEKQKSAVQLANEYDALKAFLLAALA